MILTVPHSGSRTLQQVLKQQYYPHDDGEETKFLHFGLMEGWLDWYKHVDIPIRDPFDVALSWEIRYGGIPDTSKEPKRMLEIFEYLVDYPNIADEVLAEEVRPNINPDVDIKYWDIRQFPYVLVGNGDDHPARHDLELAKTLERPLAFINWYNENPKVQKFYAQWFDDFRWL